MKGRIKNLWSLMSEHGWGIASILLTLGFGAWLISLVGDIYKMAVDYPKPLGAACAVSFAAGLLLSYVLGIRDRMKAKREEKKETERYREKFTTLTVNQKAMLYYAFSMEDAFHTPSHISEFLMPQETLLILRSRELVGRITKTNTILGSDTWAITKSAKKYLNENSDVRDDFESAWYSIFEDDEVE